MKVAPVSVDLLIKLAMGAAVLGLGYYLFTRVRDTLAGPLDSLGEVADATIAAINPASSENIINRGVSAIGGAIVSDPVGPGKNADGSWSLGGWLYDITHDTRERDNITTPNVLVQGHRDAYWKS